MSEPTLADVLAKLARIDLQNQQQTGLLTAIQAGVTIMNTTADDTKATVEALDAKVDQLISLVGPANQALRDQLAAAQAQIAALQTADAAEVATLTETIAAAQAESAKVQAAIDALTPPPAG